MNLTAAELSSVNSYIVSHDSWATLNNCSSFAMGLWNSVSSVTLSNGLWNTPSALVSSIQSKTGYVTGAAVPYDYLVYYAQGYNAPIRSTEF